MRKAVVFIFAALLLVFTGRAWAQTETGQISGTVLDEQGNGVPRAKITIRNLGTSALREANSDDQGAFIVTNLLPATYAVMAEAPGFSNLEQHVGLDAAPNNDEFTASVGQTVPLDSVQEINIVTNNFTAEYGRASAGVINVTTKSGTNDFHCTAYEFGRYAALAANPFDNNARGIAKPAFTRNQFGYSAGGPVKKDKLFFFHTTESLPVRSSSTNVVEVPTPQVIAAANSNTHGFFSKFGALRSNFSQLTTFTRDQLATVRITACPPPPSTCDTD